MLLNHVGLIKPKAFALLLSMCFLGTALHAAAPTVSAEQWVADKNNKCLLWNPYPKPNESVAWSGTCKDGYANGTGIAEWYRDGRLTSLSLVTLEAGFWYGKRKTWDEKGNAKYSFAFKNQPPVDITEEDYNKMSQQQIFEKYGNK